MTLLLLVQQVAVPGVLVFLHCYSRYSRLQYQGTLTLGIATADTVGCSTKGLGLIRLLQPVQYAAVARDTVSATLLELVTAYRMMAEVY